MENQKLTKLINHVSRSVPYYQKMFKGSVYDVNDIESVFSSIPPIDKSIIKNDVRQFIDINLELSNSELSHLFIAAQMNNGESKIRSKNKVIYYEQTSGSTGEPFWVIKTHDERLKLAYYIWKIRRELVPGVNPQNMLFTIHTAMLKEKNSIKISDGFDCEHLYSFFRENDIYMWHTNLRFVNSLIRYCESNKKCPKGLFRSIELTGLFVSAEERIKIEKYFNCIVYDFYATIETWLIAYSKDVGNYIINTKGIRVELLNERDEIIENENEVGKIVVTSLDLFCMPIIRYKTGDIGKIKMQSGGEEKIELLEGREIELISGTNKFGNVIFRDVIRSLTYTAEGKYKFDRIYVKQENCQMVFQVYVINFVGDKVILEDKFISKSIKYIGNRYQYVFKYRNNEKIITKDKGNDIFKNLNYLH